RLLHRRRQDFLGPLLLSRRWMTSGEDVFDWVIGDLRLGALLRHELMLNLMINQPQYLMALPAAVECKDSALPSSISALMSDGELEGDVEQLHDGDGHDHVRSEFHPSARVTHMPDHLRHIISRTQQFLHQLIQMIGDAV